MTATLNETTRRLSLQELVESLAGDGPGPAMADLIEQAEMLRSGVELPSLEDGPGEALSRLTFVRSQLDQLEHLLATAIRFRGHLRNAHKQLKFEADEEWASHVSNGNRRGARVAEWGAGSAPRERYAEADVVTLDKRREVVRAERFLSVAEDAVDVINRLHRGLETTRQDMHGVLRAMNVESSLER